MSAANLYRYFESKLDIGAAMASQCLQQKAEILQGVVSDSELPAVEKIETFILENLRYTHTEWANRPRVNELVDAVCQQRAELVDDYVAGMQAMFRTMVEQGVESGEFEPCDLDETAEALKAATFMFDYPGTMNLCTLEVFERKALGVARLVLNGLKKR
jgi:AcrR family transcriptional regulator